MKKNGMRKRLLLFILTAAIVLTMQETSAFAETVQPGSVTETSEIVQPENQTETPSGQPKSQSETSMGQVKNQSEKLLRQSVSQNGIPDGESVSQNDLSDGGSVSQNDLSKTLPENQLTATAGQSRIGLPANSLLLTDGILAKCTVPGLNPEGAVVNLFDYWQTSPDPEQEVAHDYFKDDTQTNSVTTYNLGISEGHLLRFGYRDNNCITKYCTDSYKGDYGAWNQYYQLYNNGQVDFDQSKIGTIHPGIVKNRLGMDGFPQLNFSNLNPADFGRYADNGNALLYLANKEESLAYLFSPSVSNSYKAVYPNVQGLFQLNSNGYYYYKSTENFASYKAGSFVLYNSPGVAKLDDNSKTAVFCGQFFPFNKAEEVFDSYYIDANGNYRLIYAYQNPDVQDTDSNYISDGKNGYIRCIAPRLNHYLGMTLEVPFLQPENGCLSNGTPMTFSFSGDDDVWIFIDDVLVADLGGLHDAYSLKIDFNTGRVYIQKLGDSDKFDHTLLTSFLAAYGVNSNLGGVAFNGETFADNTVHTLKMFYLERGHMASDLSLEFNTQPVRYDPVGEVEQNEEPEFVPDSESENTSDTEESILSVSDNKVMDSVGTPQTGDDSMIWWWAVLCIASLLGIGAVVCNLIFVKRKQAAESSKKKEKQHSTKNK